MIRTRQLNRSDVHSVQGLRAVSPALAILQLAPSLPRSRLIRLIDDFRIELPRHLRVTHQQLEMVACRFPRRATPLLNALNELQPEPTRSPWEQEWPRFAARFDLPPYEMNVYVLRYRVDVRFDGLIVMLDGWHGHGSRHAFEQDREETAEIMAATGTPVLRITHRQFHTTPRRQADRIRTIVARSAA